MEQIEKHNQRLEQFQQRIEQKNSIESSDWMPDKYRKQLIRMMSQHAHSEVVGMLPEGNWITRAPSLRRKMILLAKVQDEAGHGLYIYSAVETLGAERKDIEFNYIYGKGKYSNIFNYPTLTWADVLCIGWLVDGAAIVNQTMLSHASYGPYARAMLRICKEESFHKKQGYEGMAIMAMGTEEQQEMAQDALNRWWQPTLMMFGPPDSDSPNSKELLKWKIKTKTNDELRQHFVDRSVVEAHSIGLKIPDAKLKFNKETRHWDTSPINWDEFRRVISGYGPCNKERISSRHQAHQEGEWVREAAKKYHLKQQKYQKG